MRKSPLLIRIFSWFFIYMGAVSVLSLIGVWFFPNKLWNVSISFITNSFVFSEHPALFTATSLFFIFSGITGLMIIIKRAFAYDLGIVYCIVGLVFFGTLIISRVGLVNGQITSMVILTLFFGGFLTYLARHRKEWKDG